MKECAADSANDCVEHSFCINTYGSYICACKPGYGVAVKRRQRNLTADQFCTDIDVCENNPCDNNATCKNTDGSFTCSCNSGFVGDGLSCNDVDEGAEGRNCDQNGLSSNTPGSFRMTHSNARVKTGLVAME